MENQETYELIEKYLAQSLSDTERVAFEKRIEVDTDLAQEVREMKILHQLVELNGDKVARMQIENAAETFVNQQKLKFRRRVFAVSLVAVLAIVFFIFFPDSKKTRSDNEELFAENFTPFRAPRNVRSDTAAAYWTEIRESYEAKNFEAVVKKINQRVIPNDDYLANFYLGVSYLAMNPSNTDSAILSLKKVLNTDNDYVEIAEWYLGLAYLKEGNRTKAKAHFQDLTEKGNTYQRDSIFDLLERM